MPGQHNKRKYPKSDANFASSGKSEKQFPKSQRVLAFVTLQITVVLGRTQIRLNVPLKGLLINLKKSIRYNTIKNLFCTNRVHLELARGSDLDNQKYCSKENNFFEFGQPAARKPEKRKLEDAIDSIRQSKDMRTIANEFDEIYVRHWRGLEKLQSMINPPPERDYKTQVFYYHGPPGTGKSKTAYDEAKATGEAIYYKPRGKWWDGYEQQPNIIIDDFYGWIPYDDLKILDRYPYRVPIKGGYQIFNSKRIWITSNIAPEKQYKHSHFIPQALIRRIDVLKYFE
nr:replication association protein [Hymenolepis microstoma]